MLKQMCVSVSLLVAMACGGKDSTPTSPSVVARSLTDFVAGMQTTDGTLATRSTGAPPTASGGPAVTATAQGSTSSDAVSGGSSLVRLNAGAPFSTIFVSVPDASSDEFYSLTLPTTTTAASVVVQFARSIPNATFQTAFSVGTPGGEVGASSSIANTVRPAATSAHLEWTVDPNPVPCVVLVPPNPPAPYGWPRRQMLHETNGIGVTITNWSTDGSAITIANFIRSFSRCGPSSARIEANGFACSQDVLVKSVKTGHSSNTTFTGTDDRGNTVSVTGSQTYLDCR